ncbi:MAG: cyclic nucleotide-binding domain-containing protein, partial [Sphingobacteriales bacterium]
MINMLNLLQAIHPFSDGLLEYLDRHVKVREVARKDYLLKAGHVSRAIHFVESGLLRCYYLKGDTEVSSWFMKAGDLIISIESFHLQKPSYENIQALEDSLLYYVDYS